MVFRLKVASVVAVSVLVLVGISAVALAKDSTRFDASLSGYEELPTLSTRGNGTFEASLNKDGSVLHYTLTYEGPFDGNATGTPSNVTQAHIHFGARAFSGGISAFLCTNLGNGPAGTPACPATAGTVSGDITPASIVGPAAQGIAAGEFVELVRALRAGAAYANVHTAANAPGEIRGQIEGDKDNDD
jgi:CHRD domain